MAPQRVPALRIFIAFKRLRVWHSFIRGNVLKYAMNVLQNVENIPTWSIAGDVQKCAALCRRMQCYGIELMAQI